MHMLASSTTTVAKRTWGEPSVPEKASASTSCPAPTHEHTTTSAARKMAAVDCRSATVKARLASPTAVLLLLLLGALLPLALPLEVLLSPLPSLPLPLLLPLLLLLLLACRGLYKLRVGDFSAELSCLRACTTSGCRSTKASKQRSCK